MNSKYLRILLCLIAIPVMVVSCGEDVPFSLVGEPVDGIVPRPGSSNESGEGAPGSGESGDGNCMFYLTGEGGEGGPDLFVQVSSERPSLPEDEGPLHVINGQPDPFLGPLAFKVDPEDSSKITLSDTGWKTSYIRFGGDPSADIKITASQAFTSDVSYLDGEMELEIPMLSMSLVETHSLDKPFGAVGEENLGPVLLSTKTGLVVEGNHDPLEADGMPVDPEQSAPYPIKLVGGYTFGTLMGPLSGILNPHLEEGAILVEITGYLDRLPEEACSSDGPPPPEDGDPEAINVGPEEFDIMDIQTQAAVDKFEDMLALVGVKEAFGETVLNCMENGIDERQIEIQNTLEDQNITITQIEVFDSDNDSKYCGDVIGDHEFKRGTLTPAALGVDCEEINEENYMTPCTLIPGAHLSTRIIYRPYNYIKAEEGQAYIEDTGYVVFTYKVGDEEEEKQFEFPLKGITAPTPKDYFSVRRQGNSAPADPIKFSIPIGEIEPLKLELELVSTSPDEWQLDGETGIIINNDELNKFTGPDSWETTLPAASQDDPKLISFSVTYDPGPDIKEVHKADLDILLKREIIDENNQVQTIEFPLRVALTGSKGIPDIGDEGYKYSVQIQVVGGYIDSNMLGGEPLWAGPFYVNGREYPVVELDLKAKAVEGSSRMVKVELLMPDAYTQGGENNLDNHDAFSKKFVELLGKPAQETLRRNGTIRMWNLRGSADENGDSLDEDKAVERGNNPSCEQPSDLGKPFVSTKGCSHFYMALFDEIEGEHPNSISGLYDRQTGDMIFPGKDGQGVTLSINNFFHGQLADLSANEHINNFPNDKRIRTYLQGTLFTGVFSDATQRLMGLDENDVQLEQDFTIVPDTRYTKGLINISSKIKKGKCPEGGSHLNPNHWDVINGGDVLTEEEVLSATPTFDCYMTEGGFLKGMPVNQRKRLPNQDPDIWYYDTTFGFVGMFPDHTGNKNIPSFMKRKTAHFALQAIIKAEPN